MAYENKLTPMIPFTAWKFGTTLPACFTLIDVWEDINEIVTWIRVTSHNDESALAGAVSMAYAGLARPETIVKEADLPNGVKVYSVKLDYGA